MLPMKKAEAIVRKALRQGKYVLKNPHWSKDYIGQPAPWQRFREKTEVIGETKEQHTLFGMLNNEPT